MGLGVLGTDIAAKLAQLEFEVPDQDFSISMSRMPTLPKSGFVMRRVRAPAEKSTRAMPQVH